MGIAYVVLSAKRQKEAGLVDEGPMGGSILSNAVKVTGQNPSGLDHKNNHKMMKSRGLIEQSDKVRVRIFYLLPSIPLLHKTFSHFSSASSHPPPIFLSLHTLYCCTSTFHYIRESALQLKLLYVVVPINPRPAVRQFTIP